MTSSVADVPRHVDDAKLTGYLLSDAKAKSRSRLKFLASFGFAPDAPQILRQALLEHWITGAFVARPASAFGEHGNVRGQLATPDGRNPVVTTAWTKRRGEDVWRFTTLLPK